MRFIMNFKVFIGTLSVLLICNPITNAADKGSVALQAQESKPQDKFQIKVGVIRVTKIDLQETEKAVKKIVEFTASQDIKALLVWIDSAGGSAGYADLISRELEVCAQVKPVVALIVNNCYSAGYLIAASCDYIIAPKHAGVGSIGIVLRLKKCTNIKEVAQNGITADVQYDTVYAGKIKVASQPESPFFDEQTRRFYQNNVDQAYELFIDYVAKKRNLSLENASEWADGKDFTGKKALELGLIDQIGGYSDALNKIKSLIHHGLCHCSESLLQLVE